MDQINDFEYDVSNLQERVEEIIRCRNDFRYYAENYLFIVDSSQNKIPFHLNRTQLYVLDQLEKQEEEHGYVRAIIPKARRLGISTLIAARFFWKAIFNKHMNVFVVAHTSESTSDIFRIYKRFYDELLTADKPKTKSYSKNEIEFMGLGSRISVKTAGSPDAGRGSTPHCLHLSEISSWADQLESVTSLKSSMKLVPGTELIIESTAKGRGDTFWDLWNLALSGENEFLPIFVPWSWDPDNYIKPYQKFEMTDQEKAMAKAFGLSHGQMCWRRRTIAGLGNNLTKFNQEYPLTPSDCFNSDDSEGLFKSSDVNRARMYDGDPNMGRKPPLVIGIDPAGDGGDKTVICWRRGQEVLKFEQIQDRSITWESNLVNHIISIIEQDNPAKIFIDKAFGSGAASHLHSYGYTNIEQISFGSESLIKDKYEDRKAYMYGMLRKWFDNEHCKLPNDEAQRKLVDNLEAELIHTTYFFNKMSKMQITPKKEIKKKLRRSPDLADALALTFAVPVALETTSPENANTWAKVRNREPIYSW